MIKHTPGPWSLQESPSGGLLLVRGNDPDRMKRHPQTHLQIVPEADARLIAAAPDLLTWVENVATDSQLDAPVPALGGMTGRALLAKIAKARHE